VHECIDLVGGDTWFNCLAGKTQNLCGNRTSVSHALNNFW
jgi:hypothetical protein